MDQQENTKQMDKLVKKAIRGNSRAYGELIEHYKVYLYRTAQAYVKDEECALDIVQDCIVKAFQAIKELKQPQYFKTWITRILINTAKNHIRSKKPQVPIDSVEIAKVESGLSLEEKWDLYDAIDTLPEKYRTVIILKYFNELQIDEIAYTLEIPEGSVKSYLYRARQELKSYLQEDYAYVQ